MSHRDIALGLATLVLAANALHAQARLTPGAPSTPRGARTLVPLVIGEFPRVTVPPGNPITPEKVQLGKALFFEEQLSSDDTVACATCHMPEAGGGDPHAGARSPGDDGRMNTLDDEFGSPGVALQDGAGNFVHSPTFGLGRQVTGRNSPSAIAAAFFNTQFWDARARPEFRDLDGNVVLPKFASLESQAVGPPLSSVEMSHPDRTWDDITAKLARVRPLALATDLPATLEQFLGATTTYGPLFAQVFGDPAITRERIAMAIATYERTLVPDQAPWDLGTMTAQQLRGFDAFTRADCQRCHTPENGLFSDGKLQELPFQTHRRFVKTPTLRNVGLRKRFFSSGQVLNMDLVLQAYQQMGMFDPRPGEVGDLRAFLNEALTDPRVAAGLPPFDRPTLHSEVVPPGSNQFGVATRGSGRVTPVIQADTPPFLGNPDFKVGLGLALGDTTATLFFSTRRAAAGTTLLGVPFALDPPFASVKRLAVSRGPAGQGTATFRMPLPADVAMLGQRFYAQWFVRDPGATAGISATKAAEFEIFARP